MAIKLMNRQSLKRAIMQPETPTITQQTDQMETISFRMSAELRRRVRIFAAERGITLQDIGNAALEQYVSGATDSSKKED